MAASKAAQAFAAQRRTQAIAMKLAGADWRVIADKLGYADRGAACKDVTRALEKRLGEMGRQAELLREVELARLDRLQTALWPAAAGGDRKAIETVLKLIDRRCRLLGLDAPLRAEVVTMDAVEAEIARLTAKLAGSPETTAATDPADAAG